MTYDSPITIRRSRPSDAEDMALLFDHPRVIAGTLQMPFPSVEAWHERLSNQSSDGVSLVAEANGEVIGNARLFINTSRERRRHSAGIGMSVRADWHGRGVGTALMAALVDLADNWLNLHRLELQVFVDNEPAIRLYRKFGFEVEGTMRDYAFRDGEYVDTFVMGRLH